jgi:hypothetical protein
MAMSEAAKLAQSERMKARHAATKAAKAAGGGAAVMEREPEIMAPDGAQVVFSGAGRVSQSERFAARIRAQAPLTTTEDLEKLAGEDADVLERGGGSNVEHTTPGVVWMFKRETWGWKRGKYSRNDVAMLLNSGLLDRCGDCGSPDCPGDINKCLNPAKNQRQYLDCPVAGCNDGRGKRFFDIIEAVVAPVDNDDPLAIKNVYALSTPELRLKGMVDEHIRRFHTISAPSFGVALSTEGRI